MWTHETFLWVMFFVSTAQSTPGGIPADHVDLQSIRDKEKWKLAFIMYLSVKSLWLWCFLFFFFSFSRTIPDDIPPFQEDVPKESHCPVMTYPQSASYPNSDREWSPSARWGAGVCPCVFACPGPEDSKSVTGGTFHSEIYVKKWIELEPPKIHLMLEGTDQD